MASCCYENCDGSADHKTFEPLTSKPYLVDDAHHVFVFLIILMIITVWPS